MSSQALVVPDRFQVERVVASGGMGGVYLALDRVTGKRVALKVLHRGVLDDARFEREAVLLASLDHDAIVRYVAHGKIPDGRPYIAMEWLEGEDLGKRLSRGPVDPAEVLVLARRVAQGLDVVHRAGMVHRDVKPDNLFLVDGRVDRAKIVDFGLARRPRAMVLTADGQVVGTPGYMAPEQIRGDVPDPRVDVFALGCVLYHALAGKAPFRGANAIQVLTKVVLEEPEPLGPICPTAPPSLLSVVRRAMTKERSLRPLDARALLDLLDAAAASPAAPGRPASAFPISQAERGLAAVLVIAWFTNDDDAIEAKVDGIVGSFGARVAARLGHGAVVTFPSEGMAAEDQAVVAARAALFLTKIPMLRASLAMVHAERGSVTEAIERASTAPSTWPNGSVLVDDVTASLLPSRFERRRVVGRTAITTELDALDLARPVLGRPTPFLGRDAERDALVEESLRIFAGRAPGSIVVTGEPGIGKSRLRQEALRVLGQRTQSLTVLAARGDMARRDIPLRVLGAMVRKAAGVLAEGAEIDRRKLLARVSRTVSADSAMHVARFLGYAAGVSFEGADPALDAALRDHALMGDRLRNALGVFLSAEARASTVVVIVEDAHDADVASLELVGRVVGQLRDVALAAWVIGRPRTASDFAASFADSTRSELRLGPLDDGSIRMLARGIIGKGGTSEELDAIVLASAHNPLFVEEVASAYAVHTQGIETIAAPVVLYEARFSALPSELRAVLKAASIVGLTFHADAVRDLLGGMDGAIVDGACHELVRLGWLEERAFSRYDGHRELAFRHEGMRQAASRSLSSEDLERGHEIVGRWLERVGEHDPLVLAERFEAARRGPAAAPHLLKAADRSLLEGDFTRAATIAERGLKAGPDKSTQGALLHAVAESHRQRGDYSGALESAKAALGVLEPLAGAAQARWFEAIGVAVVAASRLRRLGELAAFADQLVERISPAPSEAQLIASARAAMLLEYAGVSGRAGKLYDFLDEVADRFSEEPLVAGRVAFARAWRAQSQGRLDLSQRLLREAQRHFDAAGDERTLAQLEANEARVRLALGDAEGGRELAAAALARAEKTHDAGYVALAKNSLGLSMTRLGRAEEAIELARAASEAYLKMGDTRLEGVARMTLAEALAAASHLPEAAAEAARAAELLERVPLVASHALATCARVALVRDRRDEALTFARRGMEILRAAGRCEGNEVNIHAALADALHAAGLDAECHAVVRDGIEALDRAAEKIEDADARARFRGLVPENARLLAVFERLGKTLPG